MRPDPSGITLSSVSPYLAVSNDLIFNYLKGLPSHRGLQPPSWGRLADGGEQRGDGAADVGAEDDAA